MESGVTPDNDMQLAQRKQLADVKTIEHKAESHRITSIAADLLESRHIFELTETQVAQVFYREIYRQVINSSAFQRLKKIHFLGSLDYAIDPEGPKPNKRHTRYQHSLGVARLALQFARDRRLSEQEEILSVVAALLHDIGHAPLSHSLESVFKKSFGIGHHLVSERIIKGDVEIGQDLHKILTRARINPYEILMILNGIAPRPFKDIFNYGINIDTIEAISRSATYLYPNHLFRPPSDILNAMLTPCEISAGVLDNFWRLKDEVYNKLITNRVGVLADFICQQYMQNHISTFDEDHFYLNDSELKDRHPKLFASLSHLLTGKLDELLPGIDQIDFVRRRFIIDPLVEVDSISAIDARYTQNRNEESLRIDAN
jgi:HD superfamily phosphohydrolase